MSSVRSALDAFAIRDLAGLADDELADHVIEIERATRVLGSRTRQSDRQIEERRAYAAEGRALSRMTATREALTDGSISVPAAALLVSACEGDRLDGRCVAGRRR